jgi:amino acid adenylation domain-containing protein
MNTTNNKIAVIGMACRFPGANNLEEYWNNLILGKETLSHFTDEELARFESDFENLRQNPDYIKVRGILNDVDKFDAGFFGITPKEATVTDPQHRIWMETAWQAFENAGCDPFGFPGAIGVFAGGTMSSYLYNNILSDKLRRHNFFRTGATDTTQIMIGNDISFIPTKTAYFFNLRGPAIYVQSACSTSLVAISQACQSLYSYESDMCLAGGVSIFVPQEKGYIYQEGAIPSSDGHCRPFDAQAKGTVTSNGVGIVVLKRVEDAIRDNDTIYALVSGWALNNDGNKKVSYTAPSVDGQTEVIMIAQSFAEVSPEEIGYVEAHGTATPLGDPIEMAALTQAFRSKTDKKQFCGIGSVKSNIGHTDSAAGVAAFIKTCLAAYYKKIPASLHYSKPNPHIDFENSPFYVQKELKEWNEERPLIMGVSSFGIGGTNAHVIVEQPPVSEKSDSSASAWPELIILSAKSEYSLDRRKQELIEFLKSKPETDIHDVAYTLGVGRNHMVNRSFLVASDIEEIISDNSTFTDGKKSNLVSKVAFMFPGQGAQYVNMGKDLYTKNETFRNILDECFKIVRAETGEDIKAILFDSNTDDADMRLASTEMTQPALFIIEYALSKVLEQMDIKPDYLIGHSIGEYTAACISGVFDMQTALKIVIKRGQLMRKMPNGSMLAVITSIDRLQGISSTDFEIAADNSSAFCTISFKTDDTEKVKTLLDKNEIKYIPLNTSHAFHSAAFDPIISEFSEYVNQFRLNTPVLPFISCLTGNFITPAQATSGTYWAQQLRNSVLFRQGISTIAKNEGTVFLEVGPDTHLSTLVRQNIEISNKKLIISTLGKSNNIDERNKILTALGNMYTIGININFGALMQVRKPRKIGLPSYPFERKRHWIEADLSQRIADNVSAAQNKDNDTLSIVNTPLIDHTSASIGISDKETTKILNIWKSMIGNEEIGLDDDFFEIGGHSLLALQILTRIKEEIGIKITLKDFLDNPTINKLNDKFIKEKTADAIKAEAIKEIDITNFPLSFIQKRIWIVSQLDGLNPAYNIPFTYQFKGELNIDIFRKSINVLFNRHFIMFSVFKHKDGEPYCEIVRGPVDVELIDYSNDISEKGEEKIFSFIGQDSRKEFNLETGPLYRLFLLKQNDSSFFFHGTIHHLIFDGWSWSIFINELISIYDSLLHNREIELEDVNSLYLDYARGLQDPDSKLHEEVAEKFWVENLKGCTPKLNFPYDYPRNDSVSGYGEKEDILISKECTLKLKEIAKKEHATPFATLLSLLGILFQRYSGENDICIGTHVANRSRSSLERIFGMFVNTIPVRLQIDDILKFGNFINYTKNVLIDAIAHQELPFEKIVEVVNPERSSNMNPIFQVAVQWISYSTKPMESPGLKVEHVKVKEGISPFDISFNLWDNDGKIEGEIEYNIDILKRDTIIRLRDNFVHLVEAAAENPDRAISEISLVSEKDIKKLSEFNQTQVAIPDLLIHNMFENQVGLTPLKTAVISEGRNLCYRDLDYQSNQMANYLLKIGVMPGDVVGLCIERSADMIVSVLGILKSGCTYLPMDPSFPEDRIMYMYEDSGAKVLISQSSLLDKFPHFSNTPIVLTDTDKEKINKCNTDKPDITISTQSFAYIIYTSGSTGKPKGVKVHHEAVVNLIESMSKVPGIKENDILLAVVTLSFDMSVYELFVPLSKGATVVVATSQDTTDGQALIDLLDKNNITMLQATPSLFNILLGSGWKGKNDLRAFCGGEALTRNLVRQILPRVKEFWNCYGPTETTVYSTFIRVTDPDTPILIGKPINNTRIHILDKNNNKLPVGVIGEVCIGGLGVTKGYHNLPELTAEKFIPFENGEIIYKTGDLGRFLTDGNIELFGRIDNQIKLRGFRIEPGEIENLLSRLPGVKEAVVKVHRFEDNDDRLVAFLNTDTEFSLTNEEITGSLSQYLPSYMVPSFFQRYDGFPRLPNGKINKKALIFEIDESEREQEIDFDRLTGTQKKLFNIWSDILKFKNIHPSKNFFDIGGNSLLAIRILNKIKEELGFTMSFKAFIAFPTIIQSGNYIDSQSKVTDKAIELIHLTETTSLPLTLNQKRIWLISKLQPDIPSYIIPFTCKFIGPLNREIFQKSIDVLFQRHHILFSIIKEVNGEPYCDIIPSKVQISFIDYTGLADNERSERVNDIMNADSRKVFDLQNGPLYRLYLIMTGSEEYYFRISIHHIIFDGWSWSVLAKDLNNIYNSLLRGKDTHLEEIEFQQYDFAQWETSSAGSKNEEESIEFWKENLQGASPILNFPYDFQRKEKSSGRGGYESIQLSQDLSEKLRKISKKEDSSLFSTMLSAFGIQMQKYSGEDDINIGLPVAYRPHSKLENIIGMFVNTVVVRLRNAKEFTFRDVIHKTEEAALNAIAHQDLPFEKVVKIVNPERSTNANPLFQVAFAWQNNLDEPIKLDGIKSERIPVEDRTSIFDITFYMWENGNHIEGEFEYNIDILRHDTIIRLRDNFLNLVSNLVENSDTAVESISMISDEEEKLIDSFNDTFTDYPKERTIIGLFEDQVQLFPDKTAVVFKEESLTYKQLNEKTNQLARVLRESGVNANMPVGILAEKSLDMIVGILGILKSGGGYVPIDPEYPEQRVNFIIKDSECRILLTQDKYMKVPVEGVRKLNLNSPETFNKGKSNVENVNNPTDLAYIMYTSGTTGMPKGSMIGHKSVVRLVRNINYLDLSSEDRILLTGAIVFDATTFEIWGALLNGGTLYIVEKETILNPKVLGEELLKNEITILWLTSALFTQIAETRSDIFGSLKYLLTGGDVLSAPHINKVRKENPNLKVLNCYGPTENTTFSTTYLIDKDFDSNIPIGKPISNSTTYIFDKNMNYQSIGIIGELYVGGDGLSKGYLNREDLNKKSFINHPHIPGEILYRTGDYARWLPDGNIEFHGRMDNQLKIRGFRVELGEIESVISEIDGIIETVVKPIKVDKGDIRLAAFLNVSDTFSMDTKELSRRIKEKLPPYMIPSAFKQMHGFPKTVNGKTDKDALTLDSTDMESSESQDLKSFTPTEMIIYNIWSESLKTKDISVSDNFFEIGGSSLLAISVFSKIESAFNVELGLRVFFDSPRIKDLGEVIEIEIQRPTSVSKSMDKKNKGDLKIVKGEI